MSYRFTGNVEKKNIPKRVNKSEGKEGDEGFHMGISMRLSSRGGGSWG